MEESQNVPESQEPKEEAPNSAKTPQGIIDKCKYDYEIGNFKTIEELASRYGINSVTLHGRMRREGWREDRERRLKEIEAKIVKKSVSEADLWLKSIRESSKKDLQILTSRLNLDEESLKKLNYEELTALIRTKKVVDDMARRSLGLSDPGTSVDVTSKGQSIGESLVQAIAKLRDNPSKIVLTDEEKQRIIEAEIVDEDSK